MLMALKYKVSSCKSGHELLMLTLSHLDGVRLYVDEVPLQVEMVNKVFAQCVDLYKKQLSPAQLVLVRHTILNFLQDFHKKVQTVRTQS